MKKLFSAMSNVKVHYHFQIDFQKMDQQTGVDQHAYNGIDIRVYISTFLVFKIIPILAEYTILIIIMRSYFNVFTL